MPLLLFGCQADVLQRREGNVRVYSVKTDVSTAIQRCFNDSLGGDWDGHVLDFKILSH